MRHPRPFVAALLVLPAALVAQVDTSLLAGMKARSIGPAGMSGRVVAIDAVEADPNTIFVGAASGGLWKSVNGGLTFKPIFDDQPVASIGAIRIFQASPDIVWIGTGEGNPRNSVSLGNGVYKSTDGGRTWRHLGLEKTERIRRIWVHPSDPDIAFVAALGTAWGENPERGLFVTRDGGESFERALFVDEKTGCIDIEVDPQNPKKMFASMWDHRRWPWGFRSGGPGSGLYRSVDGGRSWTRLGVDDGLPKGDLGRIKAAFAPSNPKIVYALVEAKKSVLLRSDDGGVSFRTVNKDANIASRPFYYCDLRIDPANPDRIYNLHSSITMSTDGGKTFRQIVGYGQAHPDHHAMWIDPSNSRVIFEGNDGGVSISRDHGKTWSFVTQLPLAQYYHIAVDMDEPYHVYGGMQDNGSWRGPSTVWENGGIRNHHWDEVCFGDGFATRPDPEDSMQGYAMSQGGSLVRWNLRTGERRRIRPVGPDGTELRFNWNAGIAQDPFDVATIYYGSQFVHRSTDRGDSWETISDDLTTNHPQWQKQGTSGGLTLDVTGAENYTSILTIAPSAVEKGVIWVGSDDGRVHVTRDGGGTWTSLENNIPGLPRNTWCPHIEPCKFAGSTAFAVFDDHRRNNLTPYLYKTIDYGETWQSLATDALRGYCLVVEQDPVDADLLFVGTEFGLWFSSDGGRHFHQFRHGFPTCSAMAMVVHPRDHDLVIGTHGRAAYVLDDIRPLRGLTQEILEEPLHLFATPAAIQFQVKQTGASRFPGQGEFRGRVRPRGAMITFAANQPGLKHPDEKIEKRRRADSVTAPKEKKTNGTGADESGSDEKAAVKPGKAKVTIVNSDGDVVRKFEPAIKLGINRIFWDLARDGTPRPSRTPRKKGAPAPRGNPVLPGKYTVKIHVGEHVAEGSVVVRPDPREEIPMDDRLAKAAMVRTAEALLARAAKVTERMHAIRQEVDAITSKLARIDKDERPGDLDTATKAAKKALVAFEKRVWGKSGQQGIVRRRGYYSKIRRVLPGGFSWQLPTETERTNLARATATVDELIAEFNKLLAGPITEFSEELSAAPPSFAPDLTELK